MKPLHRKIAALTAGGLLALGLTGCLPENAEFSSGDTFEFTMNLNDGTKVPCVRMVGASGFDCNWDKATRPTGLVTP